MKICFMAPADSGHTVKWCNYFASAGHEVHVISFTRGAIDGVQVHLLRSGASADGGDLQKLLYLTTAGQVRRLLREIRPDVVNAHYATSYGVVTALAGVKNYALSVWGSDIYAFPRRSALHKLLLQFSLRRAKYLLSTSRAMAEEASLYTGKEFEITPFGVNAELFSPEKRARTDGDFVVGTVKTMAPEYGIDTLLEAVQLVHRDHPEIPLRVRIAGTGPNAEEYCELAKNLGIDGIVCWLGFISQQQAAEEWANMDVAVVCSNSESFGVSAVEAQSCGVPVVITDVPGLMEATAPGRSSIVVSRKDARALADALVMLYRQPERGAEMGAQGREYVLEHYEYTKCFKKIETLLQKAAKKM